MPKFPEPLETMAKTKKPKSKKTPVGSSWDLHSDFKKINVATDTIYDARSILTGHNDAVAVETVTSDEAPTTMPEGANQVTFGEQSTIQPSDESPTGTNDTKVEATKDDTPDSKETWYESMDESLKARLHWFKQEPDSIVDRPRSPKRLLVTNFEQDCNWKVTPCECLMKTLPYMLNPSLTTDKVLGILEDVYQRHGLKEWDSFVDYDTCLLYTSPSPRDQRGSRMPSSA